MRRTVNKAAVMLCLMSTLLLHGLAQAAGDLLEFTDLGIASAVSESRGAIATIDAEGNPLVLALAMDQFGGAAYRTSLLIIDTTTGKTEQYWHPSQSQANGPAYSLMLASTGRLYSTFGTHFVEFDISTRSWSYTNVAGEAMSFTEAPDGIIYFATYPTSTLYSYDPVGRQLQNHGRLDPHEQYPNSLAAADDGWVYAGLGTSRSNLVAFHPETGELRQLVGDTERRVGTGSVWVAVDGQIYGRGFENGPTYRLAEGVAERVAFAPASQTGGGMRWGSLQREFGDGSRVITFDLPGKRMQIANAEGSVTEITINYISEGTQITSLVAGPGGRIYGSTSHPMHFVVYDPGTDRLTDLGHIERVGGGNFAGMAVQGDQVLGGAYAGGYLYAFDTTRPWNPEPGSHGNPRFLAEYPGPITRPRTVLAHPDGRHVIMGGFAGYGLVGGGLAIYDLETGASRLIPNNQLIPGHSVITMRVLPSGDIVAGTSVEAPGGGQPTAAVAKLFILDWQTQTVAFQTEPIPNRSVFGTAQIPGAREVVSLEMDREGLVYGIAGDGQLFVFNPTARQIVHRGNLGIYGKPIRPDQTFVRSEDGSVYALLTEGVVLIQPGTYAHQLIATPPVTPTAGTAYLDGTLYFASGTHLWSVRLHPITERE